MSVFRCAVIALVLLLGVPTAALAAAPTPGDDTLTASPTGVLDVLADDSDPDGDAITVSASTQPAHGSASCSAAGACFYSATAGFTGADSFTYTARDSTGATTQATVSVTVTASTASSAIAALDDDVATRAGQAVEFNVLTNDRGQAPLQRAVAHRREPRERHLRRRRRVPLHARRRVLGPRRLQLHAAGRREQDPRRCRAPRGGTRGRGLRPVGDRIARPGRPRRRRRLVGARAARPGRSRQRRDGRPRPPDADHAPRRSARARERHQRIRLGVGGQRGRHRHGERDARRAAGQRAEPALPAPAAAGQPGHRRGRPRADPRRHQGLRLLPPLVPDVGDLRRPLDGRAVPGVPEGSQRRHDRRQRPGSGRRFEDVVARAPRAGLRADLLARALLLGRRDRQHLRDDDRRALHHDIAAVRLCACAGRRQDVDGRHERKALLHRAARGSRARRRSSRRARRPAAASSTAWPTARACSSHSRTGRSRAWTLPRSPSARAGRRRRTSGAAGTSSTSSTRRVRRSASASSPTARAPARASRTPRRGAPRPSRDGPPTTGTTASPKRRRPARGR